MSDFTTDPFFTLPIRETPVVSADTAGGLVVRVLWMLMPIHASGNRAISTGSKRSRPDEVSRSASGEEVCQELEKVLRCDLQIKIQIRIAA